MRGGGGRVEHLGLDDINETTLYTNYIPYFLVGAIGRSKNESITNINIPYIRTLTATLNGKW